MKKNKNKRHYKEIVSKKERKNVSNIILSKKSKAQVNHHFHPSLSVEVVSHELMNHLVKKKTPKKILENFTKYFNKKQFIKLIIM